MRSAGHRLRLVVFMLPAVVALVGGCSSSNTSGEVLATGRLHPAPADTYPDFSKPLDSAMAQMTDEEAARQEAQLSALARQRHGPATLARFRPAESRTAARGET